MTFAKTKLHTVLKNHGFTLIELSIALFIFVFCIVGLIGLLSNAIHTHNETVKHTNITNITSSLLADALLVDPENIYQLHNEEYFYDEGGNSISVGDFYIYKAKVQVFSIKDNLGLDYKKVLVYALYDPGHNKNYERPTGFIIIGE